MDIILIRHGKPKIDLTGRLTAAEFSEWMRRYDEAQIDPGHPPSPEVRKMVNDGSFVVCSHLSRSVDSATMLGLNEIDLISENFREFEMPQAGWSWPRLSPWLWAVILRTLWILGYATKAEAYTAARERARTCADRLSRLAATHGSVVFVGHGLLNRAISRHLVNSGWCGAAVSGRRYWDVGSYQKSDNGLGIRW